MFLHVTKARPLDGYRVAVCFDDGREGVADLTEALKGPMFESLQDPDMFRQLQVDEELQTIVWPNGGLVILLYELQSRTGAGGSEEGKPSGDAREMIRGDKDSSSTGASQ